MGWRTGARLFVQRWWAGETGWAGETLRSALAPAEAAYAGAVAARALLYRRGWAHAERATIPVVSIGNLSVGGAGKTPFTAWTAELLQEWGRRPAVVLRGYGTDEVEVHRELNPAVPVFTAARRSAAVARAAAAGCDVAVLDDAFQHRSLRRDADVVLVAAERWEAPRRLLPCGPWREPDQALRRADLLVVTRKSSTPAQAARVAAQLANFHVPTVVAHLAPAHLTFLHDASEKLPLDVLGDQDVLAVASLADPAPFAAQLRERGAAAELLTFPDHHRFSAADVAGFLRRAGGGTVVVTLKEAVKLRPLVPAAGRVLVLHQTVNVEQGRDVLEATLRAALRGIG